MTSARTTWAGTTTSVSRTVLRIASRNFGSMTMRRIGSRLSAPLASWNGQHQRLDHRPGEEDGQEEDGRREQPVGRQARAAGPADDRLAARDRPLCPRAAERGSVRFYLTLHGPSLGGSGAQQPAFVSSRMPWRIFACSSSTGWICSPFRTIRWNVSR